MENPNKTVTIDFGNGWKVSVDSIEGAPFITAEHFADNMLSANSTIVRHADSGIEFTPWHSTQHTTEP